MIESAVKSDEQRAARGKRFLSAFTSDQISSLKSLPTLLRRGATTDLMLFYSIHAIYVPAIFDEDDEALPDPVEK